MKWLRTYSFSISLDTFCSRGISAGGLVNFIGIPEGLKAWLEVLGFFAVAGVLGSELLTGNFVVVGLLETRLVTTAFSENRIVSMISWNFGRSASSKSFSACTHRFG